MEIVDYLVKEFDREVTIRDVIINTIVFFYGTVMSTYFDLKDQDAEITLPTILYNSVINYIRFFICVLPFLNTKWKLIAVACGLIIYNLIQ